MTRARAAGMTLVEVLVALSLLSLLSAGMIAAFRVSHRAYDRLARVDRSHWDVSVAQRFLRGAIESAYPFEAEIGPGPGAVGLEGTADRLVLTTAGTLADNDSGFRRLTLSVHSRADGFEDLVVTSVLDRNGFESGAESQPRVPETVVARVQGVQWSYLDAASGGTWQNRWEGRRPPSLVKLTVIFPPGDSRSWPELIVAPRITDDANCVFDVVAQACRESRS